MQEMITTKKPWVLLIFVLVAINAIVAIGAVMGTETPLDDASTQGTIFALPEAEPTTPADTVNPYAAENTINAAAFMLLILDVLVLYGLYKGMVWTWWLLIFTTLSTLATAVFGLVNGTAIAVIPLVLNLVMFAALVKREVVGEYRPQLHILPKDGLW
jgi:hypothetical protein